MLCTQEDVGGGVQYQCSCKEKDPVCGSDNRTYSNMCQLNEVVSGLGYNGTQLQQLWMQYRGPCQSGKYLPMHTHTHTRTQARVYDVILCYIIV